MVQPDTTFTRSVILQTQIHSEIFSCYACKDNMCEKQAKANLAVRMKNKGLVIGKIDRNKGRKWRPFCYIVTTMAGIYLSLTVLIQHKLMLKC